MNQVFSRQSKIAIGVAWICAGLFPGCGFDNSSDEPQLISLAPSFSLLDVNPNSATFDQQVSPSSFPGKVTAWYFGHAT
jgi:hypothetical protein